MYCLSKELTCKQLWVWLLANWCQESNSHKPYLQCLFESYTLRKLQASRGGDCLRPRKSDLQAPQAEVILNIWKTFKQCYVPIAYYVLSFRNLIFKKGGLPEKSLRKTNKVVQRAETGWKQGRLFRRVAAFTVFPQQEDVRSAVSHK